MTPSSHNQSLALAQHPASALLFCPEFLENYDKTKTHASFYGWLFLFSALCLFVTLVIYFLAGSWRNLCGLLQISYFFTLFLFFGVEGTRILYKADGLRIKPTRWCFIHGIFSQYLSTVCSIAIMVLAFHMLWTFWKMKPVVKSRARRKKLLMLACPWLIPAVAVGSGLIYNYRTGRDNFWREFEGYPASTFGAQRCTTSLFKTLATFLLAMYLTNVLYFVATTVAIIKALCEAQFAKSSSTRRLGTDSFWILLKISLIMGMTMGYSFTEYHFGEGNPLAKVWVFGRIFFFGLQGFWLLLAFGFSEKQRKLTKEKLTILKTLSTFSTWSKKFNFSYSRSKSKGNLSLSPTLATTATATTTTLNANANDKENSTQL